LIPATEQYKLDRRFRVNQNIVTMTIAPADLQQRPGPAYRALADAVADQIGAGRLAANERLPAQRDLAFRLAVTIGTVGRAYDLLAQRGLVRGEVGRGTFVLGKVEPLAQVRDVAAIGDGLIDLTSNFPAPVAAQARLGDLFPTAESAVELLADLLRYPEVAGTERHRTAAADWLGHLGLAADPERIVLTNGAEGALAATLLALARPGDSVLAETLCYSGLRNLTSRLGQHLEPVAMDEQGIVPEGLAAATRHRGARVVVVSPNLHNPTAILMPAERRVALVAVARELDLLLVEDDVYGPLVADRPPALATLAPERTLYLSSLSKFLAPGLRLGFVLGPGSLIREVIAAQRELSLGHAPLAAELFTRAHRAGVVAEALREQRLEMGERQRLARELLIGLDTAAQPTALHVWLSLPARSSSAEAALALARTGVLVTPAERFFVGRGAAPRAVRISLSAPPTRTHLRSALQRIARVLAPDAGTGETGSLV
jgi:DNA-binding transcriptional MocR family regulator